MHRIDSDGNVGNRFSAGDPSTGQPGTVISPEWLNAIQEEICNLLTSWGLTLNKANNGQLLAALNARRFPRSQVPLVGQVSSNGCGLYSTTSNTAVDVPNLAVALTTTGRPVMVLAEPDPSDHLYGATLGTLGGGRGAWAPLVRDSTTQLINWGCFHTQANPSGDFRAPFAGVFLDTPSAGDHAYKIQLASGWTGETAVITGVRLTAFEL